MLRNKSKLAKDAISKSSIIFIVFLKKILKFFPYHQIFVLKITFLLISLLNYYSTKKQDSKRNLIWLVGLNGFEIVFILLSEIIAI